MIETTAPDTDINGDQDDKAGKDAQRLYYYRIRFRENAQEYTIQSQVPDLSRGESVMVGTDHGPEPARISGRAASTSEKSGMQRRVSYMTTRRTTREEEDKYTRLPDLEQNAFAICLKQIKELRLSMQLVKVERFFNGSKIIFFFTAESRVDFRELVKKLVQEFRTRVEMRQIGVRHETQMTGGIGACGRELCCSSFLKNFKSVSIKMAKIQDLPLNPSKISGLCNRLLCCLTYEYDSYQTMKKKLPRIGKYIRHEGTVYRVVRVMTLQGNVLAVSKNGEEVFLTEKEWSAAKPVHKNTTKKPTTKT